MRCVVCILALRFCVYYIDTMFKFVQDFAILSDPKDATKGRGTSGQNPNAGWFNKFVQTGKSDHETKSGESFGGQPFRVYCTILFTVHKHSARFVLCSIISHGTYIHNRRPQA